MLGPRVSLGTRGWAEGGSSVSCLAAAPDPRPGGLRSPQPRFAGGETEAMGRAAAFLPEHRPQQHGVAVERLHRHLQGRATSLPQQQQDGGEAAMLGGRARGNGEWPSPHSGPARELGAGGTGWMQPCGGAQPQHPPLLASQPGQSRAGNFSTACWKASGQLVGKFSGEFFCAQNPSLCANVEKCKNAPSKRCLGALAMTNAAAASHHRHAASLPNYTRNNIFQPIVRRPLGADGTPGKHEVVPRCSAPQPCGLSRGSGESGPRIVMFR